MLFPNASKVFGTGFVREPIREAAPRRETNSPDRLRQRRRKQGRRKQEAQSEHCFFLRSKRKPMKRKFTTFCASLGANTNTIAVDQNLLTRSRAARVSRRLLQASVVLNTLAPLLLIVAIFSLAAVSTFAQSPGGSIFG